MVYTNEEKEAMLRKLIKNGSMGCVGSMEMITGLWTSMFGANYLERGTEYLCEQDGAENVLKTINDLRLN